LVLACALVAPHQAPAAEPRPVRQAEGEDTGRGRRDRQTGDGEPRRDRRSIEGGDATSELSKSEPMLSLVWREGGCSIDGHRSFVKALLGLDNTSDAMSLELWGDSHEYVPFQKVFYYLRVPRAAYITMLWIGPGPNHDIFVPFQNLRIPANRDVSVDPDSIIVPPLGREQWVAVASLEPIELPCYATETDHLSWLQRVRKLPHGVGRWEVRSKKQ